MSWAWDGPIDGAQVGQAGKMLQGDYVTDMTDIDSGRWKNEGGLLANGGHKCGMMWVHKMIAKNMTDYNECNAINRVEQQDRGQEQHPMKGVRRVVYHSEATLLLQYKQSNPGHQLLDTLLSVYPTIARRDSNNRLAFWS